VIGRANGARQRNPVMNKFPYGNLKYSRGGNNTVKVFPMKKLGLIVFLALCVSAISFGQANNGT
jgi:hypothetical protein